MAITKILYRNGGLRQAIDYITNPVKTAENLLTDYVRCDPGHAAQQMMDTKRALGKTAGRQCYHIIQSFQPDEITPELAHEIARQFAAEHLPGYEAVIATHVDKAHIHSHIVFNSVNAVTGKMYHSTCENYYRQIRGVSDRLCKAHGLSIVLENGEKKTVSYAEWLRQKKSQPTFRSMLEADLHDAIEDANDLGHFFLLMEHRGYEIHHGKRLGFRLRGQEHFMYPERRNPDFSEERIEQAILGNLEQIEAGRKPAFTPRPKPQPYRPHPKHTGFLALYFHYCYLLGRIEKRQYPPRTTPHLRKEIMKADVYKARLKFLQENNITTADDLTACLQQAEAESNDLMPFKNLFNEWFIRDTSRKIRAVQKAKAERGERLGTRAPYGYVKDPETKKLIVDEEAAAVVKRIFALCAAGNGPSRIATILTKENVFCPSYYTYQKYGLTHSALDITKPYHWSDSAVANLLENEIYLGNTVNYRFSTKSYKDKRKIEHPREECLVFENTHPAIIPKEIWDIVRRVRKNKRRRTKMDEQNKYSGLVICADCGKTMVLHRAHTMSADYNHFTCRTYKKDGEACTAHYIRECILDEIVLEDLRRVTAEARGQPQEFAEYLNSKQSAELQKEIRRLEKEKAAMQKRKAELDAIFKKLYEDSVLGRITAEQFQMLSASYTEEQAKLTETLPQRESEIRHLKETVSNTAAFLDKAKRYKDIQELTPELLRLFIQKIVVHEKDVKWSKHAPQTVEIHYADIGCMENRQTAEPEQHNKIPKVS